MNIMSTDEFRVLGDRHKSIEKKTCGPVTSPDKYIVIRLDGNAFHTFTKGLKRPFDPQLSDCMAQTTRFLLEKTPAVLGYTQSDEISLVFSPKGEHYFGGKHLKLCTITAGLASARFNKAVQLHLSEKANSTPIFDARAIQYDDAKDVAEYLSWRHADCTRNSISMAAQSLFSPSALHGINNKTKLLMMKGKGYDWLDLPFSFRSGRMFIKETVEMSLSDAELEKIPELKRPNGPVLRSKFSEVSFREPDQISNYLESILPKTEQL